MPDPSDHTAAIRSQIEADVKRLRGQCRALRVESVVLGYLVNLHRGQDVFTKGELIDGLPFTVNRYETRSIQIHGTTRAGDPDHESTAW